MKKKIIRISVFIFFALIFFGLFFLLIKRDEILHKTLAGVISKLKKEDQVDLKVESIRFSGFTEIEAQNISLVPEKKDSLLQIKNIKVGIDIWPLFSGRIKIQNLELSNAWIHFVGLKGIRNYDFLLKKKKGDSGKPVHLSELIDRFINQTLYKIPNQLTLQNLVVSIHKDSLFENLNFEKAEIKNHFLTSSVIWSEVGLPWHLTGKVEPSKKVLDLKLFADKKTLSFPILKNRYHLDLKADTLQVALLGEELSGEELQLKTQGGFSNLLINQVKLSEDSIRLPKGIIKGVFVLDSKNIRMDSSSTLQIKNLKIHPFVFYDFSKEKKYSLRFHTEFEDSQVFFDALPEGLFNSLKGIKVGGKLAYHLGFHLEEKNPNNLEFEAGFTTEKFKILHFGEENLQKINGPFIYTPIENGKAMRDRLIGSGNPNYTPINLISEFLRNCVIASEDPNFYSHHGIDEYAFKKVIAIDFKAKSFKRGASTLTMQLVKNVFLSREKTVGRKAEEMLITWLLENGHISSKQRILEVYLNVIEWAPNVYGVGEASRFYFAKPPAELSLGESIFLTHIIPKPKAYQYAFNSNGSLKSYIKGYYHFLSENLLAKGKIFPADTLSMFQINLRGPAAQYIIKTPDTLSQPLDSL